MDGYEELRKKYDALMKRCEKCTNPSMCPTCSIMTSILEISQQMEARERSRRENR